MQGERRMVTQSAGRRRGVAGIALGLMFLMALTLSACKKEQQAAAPVVPVVEVVQVAQRDVPIYKDWVGSLDGSINAVIRPQVTGYLIRQNYKEGEQVKKGQILFEIDPRTFQAAVNQARASLDQARGDLAQQEAGSITAKADLARVRPLAEKNAVSRKDLDDAVGRDLGASAGVAKAKAGVAVAAANLEKAELDLEFTRITSPVDGVAGIAKTQLGNLVSQSMQEELTSVSTLDPIKAFINISEQEYLQYSQSYNRIGRQPLELILADGATYAHKGQMALADRQMNPTTGTFKIGSLFPNPDNLLRPGQYGRIRVMVSENKGALLAPQRAVTEIQGRYMIAVVGADNKVEVRPVQVGERIGAEWVIEQGLKPGELVVAEGVQKVRPGMTVTTKPFAAEKPATPAAKADKG